MGGGNPIKALTDWTSSNTIRSLTGRETSGEKSAKEAQKASLLSAQQEADTALELRKKRMEKKQQGRGSLLTSTELGVAPEALTSTLG